MTNTGAGGTTERAGRSRARHVVLLNQAFHPDVVATAQMSKDLADHLVEHGYRVTAVASRSIYGKSGAVLPKHETVEVSLPDGRVGHIEVRRVGMSIFGKASILARVADFALFYLLAGMRVLFLRDKPDVVISFTTPPFVALIGVLARWFRGAKAIYWVMDLYPDLPVACGVMKPSSLVTRLCEKLHRFVLRKSDAVVVLGRCMKQRVLDKGVPEDQIELIEVWADHSALRPVSHPENLMRKELGLGTDDCCVMYSGNFGLGHEAQTICRAAGALDSEVGLAFRMIGGGKRRDEVERYIAEHDLKGTSYHDYVPRDMLPFSLGAGDVHLISLAEGVEGIMVPSKLFGIMAIGRPALFVGNRESEIARIIEETGCGLVVQEGDDAALVAAIKELAADPERRERMGRAGTEALATRYSTPVLCEKWRELIDSLVEGGASGARAPGGGTR